MFFTMVKRKVALFYHAFYAEHFFALFLCAPFIPVVLHDKKGTAVYLGAFQFLDSYTGCKL
jgi:hypothetical protein